MRKKIHTSFPVRTPILIVANFLQFAFGLDKSPSGTICDKDVDVSMDLVNQFVRMDQIPLDPFKVISVLEKIAVGSGCNPNFFSISQMRTAVSMLKNDHLSDEDLWHMVEVANRQQLQSKVDSSPMLAWKFYSEALQKWPRDSRLRFELGKSLAAVGRYDDAIFHLKWASEDSTTFQIATYALASLTIGKKPEEAVAYYTSLIAADPSSETYWFLFADALKSRVAYGSSSRLSERFILLPLIEDL